MLTRYLLRAALLLLVIGLAACGVTGGEESTGENGNEEAVGNEETLGNENEGATTEEEEDTSDEIVNEEVFEEDVKGNEDDELEALGGGYVYRREGGIAGFCDVVTVLVGTATVTTCATEPPEVISEVTLSIEQAQLVSAWIEGLATFTDEQKDPATADAMTITITFAGQGDDEATEEVIAAMEALAVEVLRASADAPTE